MCARIVVALLEAVGKAFFTAINVAKELLCNISRISFLIVNTIATVKYANRVTSATIKEMGIIGIGSLPLVLIATAFIGGETVLQTEFQFRGIVSLRYLGMAVCKSLLTELCPVIVSFIVSSRISTSIAAEISTMKESDQIDAMTCLNLDPLRYLILPKFLACIIMLPMLVVFGELSAFLSSTVIAVSFIDISLYSYLQGFRLFFNINDVFLGIFKSSAFGLIICFIGAYSGFQSKGGAAGVGRATTNAVVIAALLILILDFLINYLLK